MGDRPLLIGVTGGIGAGKSEVLAAFARRGCPALSADAIVHRLYDSTPVRDAVVDRYGPDILTDDGEVDRVSLARHALPDPVERAWLEDLLHPRVRREMLIWRDEVAAAAPPPPLIVYESPLLYEVGLDADVDRVLVVTVPDAIRRERLARRGGLAELEAREARQLDDAERIRRADDVIVNDGDLTALDAAVGAYVERFGA